MSNKRHFFGGLLKSSKAPRIKSEAWNFAACPHPEQTEVCFLYEYSLESSKVKAAVATLREKVCLRETSEETDFKWLRANPAPKNEEQLQEWYERAMRKIPHAFVTTALHHHVRFLAYFSHFPDKHWLEIPEQEREDIAKAFRPGRVEWGSTPAHMAKRRMLIQPLEEFFGRPFQLLKGSLTMKPVPEHSGEHVFSFCWPRSDRMLLRDFKIWLEENRPKSQPPFESTGSGSGRRTSHRDLLKALSAFRILGAFKANFEEARFHSLNSSDKPLYRDQPAWRKAARKAENQIAIFERTMVRGE